MVSHDRSWWVDMSFFGRCQSYHHGGFCVTNPFQKITHALVAIALAHSRCTTEDPSCRPDDPWGELTNGEILHDHSDRLQVAGQHTLTAAGHSTANQPQSTYNLGPWDPVWCWNLVWTDALWLSQAQQDMLTVDPRRFPRSQHHAQAGHSNSLLLRP